MLLDHPGGNYLDFYLKIECIKHLMFLKRCKKGSVDVSKTFQKRGKFSREKRFRNVAETSRSRKRPQTYPNG